MWLGLELCLIQNQHGMAEVNLEKFDDRFNWEVKPQPAAADGEGKSSVDFSSLDCVAHLLIEGCL